MNYIVERNLCENRDTPSMHCDGKCYLANNCPKESEGVIKIRLRGKRQLRNPVTCSSFEPLIVLGAGNETLWHSK